MAGEPEMVSQSEIEELLRQAQAAAQGGATPAAASPRQSEPVISQGGKAAEQMVQQSEIDTVLRGGATATATATSPAPPPPSTRKVTDDIGYLLNQAEAALASVDDPTSVGVGGLAPFELRDLGAAPPSSEKATLELLRDVELDVKIELGRSQMHLEDVLKLRRGSVVTLDKLAGDPVDIYVNGRLIARGEVLVLNDNFCVRVAELLSGEEPKAA